MNIAVYCGSVSGTEPEYARAAALIGKMIGSHGHTLVYGGSNTGLMGIVADSVLHEGGQVIGVLPDVRLIHERKHSGITQYIYTDSMSDRKMKMIDLSDAYIALPGGYGTLDELSDILCLMRIEVVRKPVAIVNINGFYDLLKAFFNTITEKGFAGKGEMDQVLFSDDPEIIIKHVESGRNK